MFPGYQNKSLNYSTSQLLNSYPFVLLLALLALVSCETRSSSSWTASFPNHGTNSSPRVADLNEDGVLDVIIGVCKNELHRTDTGVIALNGANGEIIWSVPARDQIFGSALLYDINRDNVADAVIGGRQAELMAIDGRTGQILWEHFPQGDTMYSGKVHLFNFYNAQLIPDQNQDGLDDILISNGGNFLAGIQNESTRDPGLIMILSSADGSTLAQDSVPDGRETYMSPVVGRWGSDEISVVYGTGGETIGGHLYRIELSYLLDGDLSKSRALVADPEKGFIAPPILADINSDGVRDIIGNSYGGLMYALDGSTDSILWKVQLHHAEVNATPAVGYFNGDSVVDFFGYYGIGVWPDLKRTKQIMVNGATGKVEWVDSTGCFQSSSPIVLDIDGDQYDEVLMSVNDYNCYTTDLSEIENKLLVFDFNDDTTYQVGPVYKAKNLGSTPWIGDLDGDQKLDIVFTNMSGTLHIDEFGGLRVHRLSTDIPIYRSIRWGAYMGTNGDGVY